MVQVVWTSSAIQDLNGIGEYIAKESIRYAEITVRELFLSVDILEQNPRSGVILPEFGIDKIRQLVRGNYRIVYRIANTDYVEILTVHHGARLLSLDPRIGTEG